MKLTKRVMIVPVASLLLLSGCALTTPPRSEYAAFAQAGAGYAEAVDKVLVAAGEAQVDATSWTFAMDKNDGGVNKESYSKLTTEDVKYLTKLQSLKEHSDLLGLYFSQLNSLATSDAPEKTKGAMEGVVKNLTDMSSKLNASYPDIFNALPQLANIAVDMRIRGALREELDKRKDVIRRELCIQELLLKTLSMHIADGLKTGADAQKKLLVTIPIISKDPLGKPEEWVSKRREVMYLTASTLSTSAGEVDSVASTAKKMRETFESLLAGDKDAMDRINALVREIENVLAVVKANKS